jgi:hypothetical protein
MLKQLEPYLMTNEAKIAFSHVNSADQQCYIVFDKKEKHPVNLFLVTDSQNKKHEILIFSNQMMHIVSIDLNQIECFIVNQLDANVFALILRSQPNVLF